MKKTTTIDDDAYIASIPWLDQEFQKIRASFGLLPEEPSKQHREPLILHIMQQLYQRFVRHDGIGVKNFWSEQSAPNQQKFALDVNDGGWTLLHRAARKFDASIFLSIWKTLSNDTRARLATMGTKREGDNPAHLAMACLDTNGLQKWFSDHRMTPKMWQSWLLQKDNKGFTALDVAAMQNPAALPLALAVLPMTAVQQWVKQSPIKGITLNSRRPHLSNNTLKVIPIVPNRAERAVGYICINYLADKNLVGSAGDTPQHWAAYRNDLAVLKLLDKNGIDSTVKDHYGHTALDAAFMQGSTDCAKWLHVEKGMSLSFNQVMRFPNAHDAIEALNRKPLPVMKGTIDYLFSNGFNPFESETDLLNRAGYHKPKGKYLPIPQNHLPNNKLFDLSARVNYSYDHLEKQELKAIGFDLDIARRINFKGRTPEEQTTLLKRLCQGSESTTLIIEHCTQLTYGALKTLAKNSPNLMHLTLDHCASQENYGLEYGMGALANYCPIRSLRVINTPLKTLGGYNRFNFESDPIEFKHLVFLSVRNDKMLEKINITAPKLAYFDDYGTPYLMQINTRSNHSSIRAHEKSYQSTQLLYQNRFKGKNEDKWHDNFIQQKDENSLEPTHIAALLLSAKEFKDYWTQLTPEMREAFTHTDAGNYLTLAHAVAKNSKGDSSTFIYFWSTLSKVAQRRLALTYHRSGWTLVDVVALYLDEEALDKILSVLSLDEKKLILNYPTREGLTVVDFLLVRDLKQYDITDNVDYDPTVLFSIVEHLSFQAIHENPLFLDDIVSTPKEWLMNIAENSNSFKEIWLHLSNQTKEMILLDPSLDIFTPLSPPNGFSVNDFSSFIENIPTAVFNALPQVKIDKIRELTFNIIIDLVDNQKNSQAFQQVWKRLPLLIQSSIRASDPNGPSLSHRIIQHLDKEAFLCYHPHLKTHNVDLNKDDDIYDVSNQLSLIQLMLLYWPFDDLLSLWSSLDSKQQIRMGCIRQHEINSIARLAAQKLTPHQWKRFWSHTADTTKKIFIHSLDSDHRNFISELSLQALTPEIIEAYAYYLSSPPLLCLMPPQVSAVPVTVDHNKLSKINKDDELEEMKGESMQASNASIYVASSQLSELSVSSVDLKENKYIKSPSLKQDKKNEQNLSGQALQSTLEKLIMLGNDDEFMKYYEEHQDDLDLYATNASGQNLLLSSLEFIIDLKLVLALDPDPKQYRTLHDFSPITQWFLQTTLLSFVDNQWANIKKRLLGLGCHRDLIDDAERYIDANAKKDGRAKILPTADDKQKRHVVDLSYRKNAVSGFNRYLSDKNNNHAIVALRLRHSNFTGTDLVNTVITLKGKQKNLRKLDLSELNLGEQLPTSKKTSVFQLLLPHLSSFVLLEGIDLHNTQLTNADVDALLQHMANRIYPLIAVNLSNNPKISQDRLDAVNEMCHKTQQRADLLGVQTANSLSVSSTQHIEETYNQLVLNMPMIEQDEDEPYVFTEERLDADGDCGLHFLEDVPNTLTREAVKKTFLNALNDFQKGQCLAKLFQEELAHYAAEGYDQWRERVDKAFDAIKNQYKDIEVTIFHNRYKLLVDGLNKKIEGLNKKQNNANKQSIIQMQFHVNTLDQLIKEEKNKVILLKKENHLQAEFFKILQTSVTLGSECDHWKNTLQSKSDKNRQYIYRKDYPETFSDSVNLKTFLKQQLTLLKNKNDAPSQEWKKLIEKDLKTFEEFDRKIAQNEAKRKAFLTNPKNLSVYLDRVFSARSTTHIGELSLQAYSALCGDKTTIYLKGNKFNTLKKGINHLSDDKTWKILSGRDKPRRHRHVLHTDTRESVDLNHYNRLNPANQNQLRSNDAPLLWLRSGIPTTVLIQSSLKSYCWLYEQLETVVNVLSGCEPILTTLQSKPMQELSAYERLLLEAHTLKAAFGKDKTVDLNDAPDGYAPLLRPDNSQLTAKNAAKQLATLQKRCAGLSFLSYIISSEHDKKPPIFQLTKLLNKLSAQYSQEKNAYGSPSPYINDDQVSISEKQFTHNFSITLGNMYTTSQVRATDLIKLDNYLTQWEKNLKLAKDLFCGVVGFFGGAGHLLDAAGSFVQVLKTPVIEKGADLAIACGGAFEMSENGLELIHNIHHLVKGHSSHHSNHSKKPGGRIGTTAQLKNLNHLFSGCQEFNSKHGLLIAQLAFCYQDQLELIDEHHLGVFARACGDHWLEALMMGYVQTNLPAEELLEKGMIWMSYVKMRDSTNTKIRLKSGEYISVDDLLKKPRIKAHYQVPMDNQNNIDFPSEGNLRYSLIVNAEEQTLCQSLKDRIITRPEFDARVGFRHASKAEITLSRQGARPTQLIVWENVMTLSATRPVRRNNKAEDLFQYIHHTPCPYSGKFADLYYLTWLENRIVYLEGVMDNKIDLKHQKALDEIRKEKNAVMKELKLLKEKFQVQAKKLRQVEKESSDQQDLIDDLRRDVQRKLENVNKLINKVDKLKRGNKEILTYVKKISDYMSQIDKKFPPMPQELLNMMINAEGKETDDLAHSSPLQKQGVFSKNCTDLDKTDPISILELKL